MIIALCYADFTKFTKPPNTRTVNKSDVNVNVSDWKIFQQPPSMPVASTNYGKVQFLTVSQSLAKVW